MSGKSFTDGATMVCLGALRAGVNFFAGYPITPSSDILAGMIRQGVGIETPDEITAMQYLIGASLNGHKAMTATSGPGFLLMAEGIGEAFAMEAPLVVVLVQRLGPSTGLATWNAQGDIAMAENIVSGGYTLPMLCPSTVPECAELTAHAVGIAETLRMPVILLTEKDMIAGKRVVDFGDLPLPTPVYRELFQGPADEFAPYGNLNRREVPAFRPLGDDQCRVRATASTHDAAGDIAPLSDDVRLNMERLHLKNNFDLFPEAFDDIQKGSDTAVLTYGYSAYSAKEAVKSLRRRGEKVSLLVARTLFPVLLPSLTEQLKGVKRLVVAEENHTGQYLQALRGAGLGECTAIDQFVAVNAQGNPLTPEQIEDAVIGSSLGDAQ